MPASLAHRQNLRVRRDMPSGSAARALVPDISVCRSTPNLVLLTVNMNQYGLGLPPTS